MGAAIEIRPGRIDEADGLSALVMRAKAHWGYDSAFLEACREELRVHPHSIRDGHVWVAEAQGMPVGVLDARTQNDAVEVVACFVDPAALGRGVGRRLWAKVEEIAEDHGAAGIEVDSDPHAEGFYLSMGAQRIGEAPSGSIPGRMLPRLRKVLR